MSKWMVLVALAATIGFVSTSHAADKAKGGVHGKVSAIDTKDGVTTITLTTGHKGETKELKITANSDTKVVKADGSAGTLAADIVVGANVAVTGDEGKPATTLTIHEHKKKT